MKPALILGAILGLAACSSQPLHERQAQRLEELLRYADPAVEHFPFFRMDGWQLVDAHHILLRTTARDAYLLDLGTTCPELNWAENIGITSTVNQVQRRFDSVVVRGLKCRIEEIKPVRYDEMLADQRAAKRGR